MFQLELPIFILVAAVLCFTEQCEDDNPSCKTWASVGQCQEGTYTYNHCPLSCGFCDPSAPLVKEYDVSKLPEGMEAVRKLVGRWRSEFGGKVHFPTIPVFSYGEQIDFVINDSPDTYCLNYTAFAWTIGGKEKEDIHSETGFLAVKRASSELAFTIVMNNAFITVEEGFSTGDQMKFKLKSIARVSWSRDLTVKESERTFTFIDDRTLEHRFSMSTITHPLQEHSIITYRKIYP